MNKFILGLLLLIAPIFSSAQSATAVGAVVDKNGIVWSNATITTDFTTAPGYYTAQYSWTGGALALSGPPATTDSNGTFSINLPANIDIYPSPSFWRFTICPKSSSSCAVFNLFLGDGVNDISTQITSKLPTSLDPTFIQRVYNTSQIGNPNLGALVYNLGSNSLQYWNGTIWQDVGSGSGPTPTPTTSAVAYNPAAGTFTSTQLITLASSTPGALIYYTTDNSTPTVNSTQYTNPISVAVNTVIKALAKAPSYLASVVNSASYIINSSTPTVPMSAMTLGTDQPWNGFLPGASSDVLRQDVSSAPTSPRNAAFQTQFGAHKLDVDASIPVNVVNSKTQQVTWTSVITQGYPTPQVPLVGNEVVEGGSDHHMIVNDIGTGIWYDYYHWQVNSDGTIQAESSYSYNANNALDGQQGIGLDSSNLAGTPRGSSLLRYEDAVAGTIKYSTPIALNFFSAFYHNGMCYYGTMPPATHGDRTTGCMGNQLTTVPALATGDRFVLDPNLDLSGYAPEIQNILKAWQKYGLNADDIGGDGGVGFVLFETNSNWNVDHLAQIKANITMANFRQVAVGNVVPILPDSNDDANGSDSVAGTWSETQNSDGTYTPVKTPITFAYLRPTITASTSASTVAIGSSITLSASCVNGHDPYFDNAPPLSNGSIIVSPQNSTTYTPYCRGPHGIVKGTAIPVTVTGPTVATPAFSPVAGTYSSVQSISITTATSGAIVHFTRDGSTPTCNSTTYTAPFNVSAPETDKAIACKANAINSAISSAFYNVNIAGATPTVVQTMSDRTAGASTQNYTAGNKLLIGIFDTTGTATIPLVTCGTKTAVSLGHVANIDNGWSMELQYISNVDGGSQSCNVGTGNSYYYISEVRGSSGLDGSASTAVIRTTGCPSITTTGPNRLGFAALGGVGSNPIPAGNSVGAYLGNDSSTIIDSTLTTTGSYTIASTTGNGYQPACIAVALQP